MEKRVLFVCLGNICRSPLAEALFVKNAKAAGLADSVLADSCGTSNYHIGDPPDRRSYANALANGVTIEHAGRQLQYQDLLDFDYIFAMDQQNLRDISELSRGHPDEGRIMLMREFDSSVNGLADVPDPYYGGDNGFQEVYEILDRSTRNFVESIGTL